MLFLEIGRVNGYANGVARIIPLSAALVCCAAFSALFMPSVALWVSVGAGAVLLIATIIGSTTPRWRLFGPALLRAPRPTQVVALSFDDGPDPASTEALLNALNDAGARAIFFVLLDRAEAHPQLLRRIAERCELGLHGATHDAHLVFSDPHQGAAELNRAAARLEAMSGRPIRYYRPPFGVNSPRLFAALQKTQLSLIWCSVRAYDGAPISDARWLSRCGRARGGDIVLMHEGDRPARRLLPTLLKQLKERGLICGTLSECLEQ